MNLKEAALTGLIDYAGLYPPAALDMQTAVRNYLEWRKQDRSWFLGRFIVDFERLHELRAAAGGDALPAMQLSVIAPTSLDPALIEQRTGEGFRIECVEMKCDEPLTITRLREGLPSGVECYFEIPIRQAGTCAVDAIAAAGARAKLRMGGVVAEAFPAPGDVVEKLMLLADRRVPFKATAGLHHALRSRHRLTYAPDSPSGTMHGFINLLCAAAVIHFCGSREEAQALLDERDPSAFRATPDCIAAHTRSWNAHQLRQVRQFFTSFGSCSFTEPLHDLEALGWL